MYSDIGIKTNYNLAEYIELSCANAFRILLGKAFSRLILMPCALLLVGLIPFSQAQAVGNIANGAAYFNSPTPATSTCGSCHGTPQANNTAAFSAYGTTANTLTVYGNPATGAGAIAQAATAPGYAIPITNTVYFSPTDVNTVTNMSGFAATLGTFGAPSQAAQDIQAFLGTYVKPTGAAQSATVNANSSNNIIDLSATITGGTPTSITVSSPTNGTTNGGTVTVSGVTGNNVTQVTFTPTAGYGGAASFSYTVTNLGGTSTLATVSITVTPVVPGVPTGVAAVTNNAGGLTVSFTAPTNTGGAAITAYSASCTSTNGGTAGSGTWISGTSINVPALTTGANYTCTVTATNSAGAGSASAASGTAIPTAPPGAPTGVAAATNNTGGLTVSFTAPPSNGATISAYSASCTSTNGGTAGSGTWISGTSINVPALTTGANYTCTVTATNSAGAGSASAASGTAIPTAPPGAPTGVSAATAGAGQLAVSFTAPINTGGTGILGYTATCTSAGQPTGTLAGGTSPITVSSMTGGSSYVCSVTANNSAGTGAAGTAAAAIPLAISAAPSVASVVAGNTTATINFSAPSNTGGGTITGYTASCTPVAGGTATTATGAAGATSITVGLVTPLANGTAYNCNVAATTSGAGLGTASANQVVTPATVPGVPTSVTAVTNNAGGLTVAFVDPANGGATINNYTATCTSATGITGSAAVTNNATATSITVSGLTTGASYSCSVTAANTLANSSGTGVGAPGSTATTAIPTAPPGAPTGVTAVTNTVSGQLLVNFTAPANNGAAITGYSASCTPAGGGTAVTASVGASATSAIVTTLTNGTAYICSVTATNSAGTGAAGTITGTATPTTTPTAPGIVTPIVIGNGFVDVTIIAPANNGGAAITGYTVTTNPAGGVDTNANTTALTHRITGLANHTTYNFTVTATNSAGTNTSAASAATPEAPPTAANSSANVLINSVANVVTPAISGTVTVPGLTLQSGPLHGSALVNGANNTFTYTPASGYVGPDSLSYTVTGPGGTSPTTTITINVIPPKPTASNTTMTVNLNQSITLDLGPPVTSVGVTGVGISVQPVHGAISVSGTKVTYTPTKDYFGTDTFKYLAYSTGGVSDPATVAITIIGRPDPTKDARVTGLVNIQTSAIKRFGTAQLFNFQQRLESRHHAMNSTSYAGSPGDAGNMPAPAGGALPGQTRGYFNSWQPGTVLNYANDPNSLLLAPTRLNNERGATSTPELGMLMSALTGVVASSSLNLGTISSAVNAGQEDSFSRLEVWAAGNLRFGTRSQSGVDSKFTTDGISIGADKRIDRKLTLGMGIGFAHDKSTIGTDGTDSTSSGSSVAGYGSYQMDTGAFLDGLLGYGKVNFDTNRYVTSVNDFARASRTGDQLFGSLSFGYDLRKEGLLWSPYGRYDFAFNRLNEGTESGAGANALSYASQNVRSSHLAFGMRAQSVHQTSFGVVQPHARFEYQHAFEANGQTSVAYADLPGVQYSVAGTSQNNNAVVLGLGSDFVMSDTLRFAFDYQRLRSGGFENYQSINFRLTKDIQGKNDLAALLEESYSSSLDSYGLMVAAGFAYDDNVSRAEEVLDKLSDTVYSLTLSKAKSFAVTKYTKLTISGFLDVEKFRAYTGLGHISGGMQGEFMYRVSGDFGSPTFGVFARYTADEYESFLRDGSRRSTGVTLRKPLTDRINLFAALANNVRTGKSDVFNTRDVSGRMNLDYSLATDMTIYVTGEYRKGDIVSSGRPSLKILDTSTVFVRDDVFVSPWFYDYRMKGKTNLLTLGYNLSFGARDSVDISWRHVKSSPDKTPAYASPMQYIDNQYSVSYLTAF